ncbi:MAG: divergent polysaccharide deacetylase family protein [Epsilonproteobacteria bacterium]|nr:MAG: divergent polysaccharide deacetylase family protein [Campylobacterota bacterium]
MIRSFNISQDIKIALIFCLVLTIVFIFLPTINSETNIEPAIKASTKTKIQKEQQEPILTNTKKQNTNIIKKTKPMLVLICDDVVTSSQINKINTIKENITISFLPPTSGHKNSAKIATSVSNYMVHYPMEAIGRKVEEENTIRIDDSYNTILKRTKQLKAWYPNANITNNHTGSLFTKDGQAMDRLMRSLKELNYIFLDSKTVGQTVAKKYADKHGVRLLQRDVFLDNIQNRQYIRKQLKIAVSVAKRKGKAIAIFHPHKLSVQTIKTSKDILKGVNIVYIKEIL